MKSNIDRVAVSLENYWQQYALNSDGTRDFDMSEACPWLNSQHANDLVLRTAGFGKAVTTVAFADIGATSLAALGVTGAATAASEGAATCPGDAVKAAEGGSVADAGAAQIGFDGTANAISNWQAVGLGSTRGVFIMQPLGATKLPAGTAVVAEGHSTAATAAKNDAFILGGVAPSGTSYCLVKVFDADDRSLVGEYRYERESDGTKVQWSKRCTNVVDTSEKPGNWRAVID